MAPSPTPTATSSAPGARLGRPAPRTPLARIVKTKHVFHHLLRRLAPDVVLDIGSRDGSDALAFRAAAPRARILAFEAHPRLSERMRADPRLRDARVEVLPYAVSDRNGEATFSIMNEAKQLGSLLAGGSEPAAEELRVPTRRLDDLPELADGRRMALWIDVEGCSYEVAEGAGERLDSVILIHAEAEWEPQWEGQRLADELTELLAARGFTPFFTGVKRSGLQGNIVYLRRELAGALNRPATLVRSWLARES